MDACTTMYLPSIAPEFIKYYAINKYTNAVGEIPKLFKLPADSDPLLFIGGYLHILTLNKLEDNLENYKHNCSVPMLYLQHSPNSSTGVLQYTTHCGPTHPKVE